MSKEQKTHRFLLDVGRYTNKDKGLDFPTYTAYIGKKQKKIQVAFRRDVKDLPTEMCYLTVEAKNMSIDNSKRYPRLWIHAIKEIETYEAGNQDSVNKFFGEADEVLPF